MTRQVLGAFMILAFTAVAAAAQPKIEQGTMKRVPANDGAAMFTSYCAACHGATGVGNGPAASALTKAPADLTKITARNKGEFPEVRIRRYIEGLDEFPAHGSRDMPMWGELFRAVNRDTALLRVQALSDYLKSIQK